MELSDVSTDPIIVRFDESNNNWNPNPEYNAMFLRSSISYIHDKFVSQGHLFVNEVFDILGMPRTPEGCVLGWVRNDPMDVMFEFTNFETATYNTIRIIPDGLIWDKI